ncbi:MAG: hypothetical protein EBU90_01630 [Proteobacteria bacterium]|nr:hypothetical protein [Pseudomonadota bacterium]
MISTSQYNDAVKLTDGLSKTLFMNRVHVINEKSKKNYEVAIQDFKTIRAAFNYAYQRNDEPRFSQLQELLNKLQKDNQNLL